jgi:hypothetical protein
MMHFSVKKAWWVAGLIGLGSYSALANSMSIVWVDAVGDASPVGDVASATLNFDQTGAWTAIWKADAAHPFTGNARFNLNLFDLALGNAQTAIAPQVSLDAIHDFGVTSSAAFSYSGNTPFLASWHVGDQVVTGNNTNFISGVVDLRFPYPRDNMVTTSVIMTSVPEPATYALMTLGLVLLAVVKRRQQQLLKPRRI